MATELFADVGVRARIFNHPQAIYTYQVPVDLRGLIEPGRLVWVPLRRKRVQGVVLGLREASPQSTTGTLRESTAAYTIRPIDDLGDPEVRIPEAQLALARWVSDYYRASLWDALALLLPPGIMQESLPA